MSAIRKSDVPVIDMFNADEEFRAIGKAIKSEGHGRNIVNLNNYVIGVGIARRVSAGDKAKDIAAQYAISAASVSKTQTVAIVAMSFATANEELAGCRENLAAFWANHWENNPGEHAPLADVCAGLVGDDGDVRADSLVTMLQVFGAPSTAYQIVKGTHAFFAADPGDEDGDEDGDDGDEDGDDETTSWQDRLTALIGQAKLEGAATADILAVVKAAL